VSTPLIWDHSGPLPDELGVRSGRHSNVILAALAGGASDLDTLCEQRRPPPLAVHKDAALVERLEHEERGTRPSPVESSNVDIALEHTLQADGQVRRRARSVVAESNEHVNVRGPPGVAAGC